MTKKLDVKAIANALAIITAIGYVLCAILIWLSPSFATSLFNYLMHGINLSNLVVVRSFGYYLTSLILGTAISWISGALFALIYNKLAK